MIKLQPQIRQRQQPPEQRHRTVQIVIRHGMQTARALQQRQIMGDQTQAQQQRAAPAYPYLPRIQKNHIASQADRVGYDRQNEINVVHWRFSKRRLSSRGGPSNREIHKARPTLSIAHGDNRLHETCELRTAAGTTLRDLLFSPQPH